jgi:hypothetical protein
MADGSSAECYQLRIGELNMYAGLKFIPLILAGIAAIVWGLPASHRLRFPFGIGAALAVLAGVVMLTMGILLTIIPDFFR